MPRLADERDQLVNGVWFVEARESVGVVPCPVPLWLHAPIMSVAGSSPRHVRRFDVAAARALVDRAALLSG